MTVPIDSLVAWRMQEWGMEKHPSRLQVSVRKVLSELTAKALLALGDKRLEVRAAAAAYHYSVWAYFPIWPRWSRVAKQLAASGITFNPKIAEEAMLDAHGACVRQCQCGSASRYLRTRPYSSRTASKNRDANIVSLRHIRI